MWANLTPFSLESDCWVECFYATILGSHGAPPMTALELIGPWEEAYGPGGCPALPPYVPPASAGPGAAPRGLKSDDGAKPKPPAHPSQRGAQDAPAGRGR